MKKEKFENLVAKVTKCKMEIAGTMVSAMAGMPMIVKADDNDWAGGNQSASDIVVNIAEMVVNIFPLIGVFFVIAGAFKLINAYRNDQPEQQSAAAKDIVIGAVFLAFRAFAWPALSGIIGKTGA